MEIISNGSKWAGEEPDSLETLIEVLTNGKDVLDSTFENYGNFIWEENGVWNAFGNFETVSHVFNITGTAEELRPLAEAIQKNVSSLAYISAKMDRLNREEKKRRFDDRTRQIQVEKRYSLPMARALATKEIYG
jgi:hypothetical protein